MGRLQDKVVVVTGGGQGIGEAIVRRLAEEGARVAVWDLNAERGAAVAKDVGGRFDRVDVTDAAAVAAAMDRVAAELGGPQILVNNAGIIRDNWITRMSVEDWDLVVRTNLSAPFYCIKAAVTHMKKAGYGRIVNISSRAFLGNPGQSNYSAAKGGLVSLTRTLALELGAFGIHVNAVAPGLIDTPLARGLRPDVLDRLIQAQPTKKMGSPRDVANAVLFLAGEESAFTTGHVLFVCGGKSVFSAGV